MKYSNSYYMGSLKTCMVLLMLTDGIMKLSKEWGVDILYFSGWFLLP